VIVRNVSALQAACMMISPTPREGREIGMYLANDKDLGNYRCVDWRRRWLCWQRSMLMQHYGLLACCMACRLALGQCADAATSMRCTMLLLQLPLRCLCCC
jgi:hypothetical protein